MGPLNTSKMSRISQTVASQLETSYAEVDVSPQPKQTNWLGTALTRRVASVTERVIFIFFKSTMPVCVPGCHWAEDELEEKGLEMIRKEGLETGNILKSGIAIIVGTLPQSHTLCSSLLNLNHTLSILPGVLEILKILQDLKNLHSHT